MFQPFPEIFGVALFSNIPIVGVLGLYVIYCFAYVVKGAIGVGNVALMVLFGSMILGPHHAIVLAAMANAIIQVQFLPLALRDGDWLMIRAAIPAYILGISVGVWIFGTLDPAFLGIILGGTMAALTVLETTGRFDTFFNQFDLRSIKFLLPFATLSGLIVGVTGAGGLLILAFYVKQLTKIPTIIRGTILLLGILLGIFRVITLVIAGYVNTTLFVEIAVLLPIGLLGGWMGIRFFNKLGARQYHMALNGIIIFASALLVVKASIQVFS